MEIDEEADEIEQEIDVIYSGEFKDEMSLLQFPLMPIDNFKQNSIGSLSINRQEDSLKLEKNIDINYLDQHSHNLSTVQVMEGQSIEPNTNLMIGIFRNNQLFLTPLSKIYQFRHDFSSLEDEKLRPENFQKKAKNINSNKNTNLTNEKINNNNSNNNIENEINKDENLLLFPPTSIDSCKIIEKIVNVENYMNQDVNFLNKEEYFNLLLKYINDKSVTDELNAKAIPPDDENNIPNDILLSRNINRYKNDKDINKNNNNKDNKNIENNNKLIKEEINNDIQNNNNKKSESFVGNLISQIFARNDILKYEYIFEELCKNLNIDKSSENAQTNQIKQEIYKYCIVLDNHNNTCFIRNLGDEDIKNIRIKLIEYISQNNGVKKQQIKNFLKENNLSIQDAKLNRLLKSFCNYNNSMWMIKEVK